MTDTTYNGWTNWETWQILLWCDNEPATYEMRRDWLRALRNAPGAVSTEDFFRDMFPEGTPDMDTPDDLDHVNWGEIAAHMDDEWLEVRNA